MNKSRILDLADIIQHEKLPLVRFNMARWARPAGDIDSTCGTVACIAGYAVAAAYGNKAVKRLACCKTENPYKIPAIAMRILGLNLPPSLMRPRSPGK